MVIFVAVAVVVTSSSAAAAASPDVAVVIFIYLPVVAYSGSSASPRVFAGLVHLCLLLNVGVSSDRSPIIVCYSVGVSVGRLLLLDEGRQC